MINTQLPDFDALWDYGDPAETAVRFHQILPQARSSGNMDYLVELLTQIARTQGLQDNFDEAHTILDEAEGLLTEATAIPRIRYLLERGRTFNSSGGPETAVPLFQEAYELGSSSGQAADYYTVDAAHMLGIALPTNEEQLEWNLVALESARNSQNERAQGWQGSLLNNIGWTYFDREEYEKSLAIFQEALTWRQENNPDDLVVIGVAKWCVARNLRALGRVEESLAMQEALLAEYEANGVEQDGFVFEELGECLWFLGREEEARPNFTRAFELLSQTGWFSRSNPERLERMKLLGQVEG